MVSKIYRNLKSLSDTTIIYMHMKAVRETVTWKSTPGLFYRHVSVDDIGTDKVF